MLNYKSYKSNHKQLNISMQNQGLYNSVNSSSSCMDQTEDKALLLQLTYLWKTIIVKSVNNLIVCEGIKKRYTRVKQKG